MTCEREDWARIEGIAAALEVELTRTAVAAGDPEAGTLADAVRLVRRAARARARALARDVAGRDVA
jgi:hypothetical protein